MKSFAVWYEQQPHRPHRPHRTGTSRSHKSILSDRLAEKVWCIKSQSSLVNITFASVGTSRLSYSFTSATVRVAVYTSPKCGTQPVRYVTLHFPDRRGAARLSAAQLFSVTEIAPKLPLICVNRSPIRYDFRTGANATVKFRK